MLVSPIQGWVPHGIRYPACAMGIMPNGIVPGQEEDHNENCMIIIKPLTTSFNNDQISPMCLSEREFPRTAADLYCPRLPTLSEFVWKPSGLWEWGGRSVFQSIHSISSISGKDFSLFAFNLQALPTSALKPWRTVMFPKGKRGKNCIKKISLFKLLSLLLNIWENEKLLAILN